MGEYVVENRVVANKGGKAVGVFVALEQDYIVGFETFGFVDGQEFYFPSLDGVEEALTFFGGLIGEGEVVVVEGVATKEEYGFAKGYAGEDFFYFGAVRSPFVGTEFEFCVGLEVERAYFFFMFSISFLFI